MKKLGKTGLIIITLVIAVTLIGVTYAFFNYYKEGSDQKLIAGQVYLKLVDGTDTLMMTNMFPETIEEARDETRTDNVITFTVGGKNTSDTKKVKYSILLSLGDDVEGRIRLKAKDLRFDLIEVNGDTEKYIKNAVSFDSINDTLLHSQTINANTTTQITKTYKLRMWIDESVIISDTYEDADYNTQVYKNSFASVKVAVSGEFIAFGTKQYNYMVRSDLKAQYNSGLFWPDDISRGITEIADVNFVSMTQDEIDARCLNAEVVVDLTDTTKEGGKVMGWIEQSPFDEYLYSLYIASDGITVLPEDCSTMFSSNIRVYPNPYTVGWTNLTSINFSNVDTSNVKNMSTMFGYLPMSTLDLSVFDTSNVTLMSGMFYNCSNLTSLDISNFTFNDTLKSDANNYTYLFGGMSDSAILTVNSATEQEWILGTDMASHRPSGWTTANVVTK